MKHLGEKLAKSELQTAEFIMNQVREGMPDEKDDSRMWAAAITIAVGSIQVLIDGASNGERTLKNEMISRTIAVIEDLKKY